jgi:hypothetical protein
LRVSRAIDACLNLNEGSFNSIPGILVGLFSSLWIHWERLLVLSQSNNNKIYNNTISNSQYGINLIFGSLGNTFSSNIIKNYSQVSNGGNNGNNNTFYNNQLINSPSQIANLGHGKPSSDFKNNLASTNILS